MFAPFLSFPFRPSSGLAPRSRYVFLIFFLFLFIFRCYYGNSFHFFSLFLLSFPFIYMFPFFRFLYSSRFGDCPWKWGKFRVLFLFVCFLLLSVTNNIFFFSFLFFRSFVSFCSLHFVFALFVSFLSLFFSFLRFLPLFFCLFIFFVLLCFHFSFPYVSSHSFHSFMFHSFCLYSFL